MLAAIVLRRDPGWIFPAKGPKPGCSSDVYFRWGCFYLLLSDKDAEGQRPLLPWDKMKRGRQSTTTPPKARQPGRRKSNQIPRGRDQHKHWARTPQGTNRERAPSGPVKVVVTNRPHSRRHNGVDLVSGVSALLAWFPASWASKIAPCFIGEEGGSIQLPQEVAIVCPHREFAACITIDLWCFLDSGFEASAILFPVWGSGRYNRFQSLSCHKSPLHSLKRAIFDKKTRPHQRLPSKIGCERSASPISKHRTFPQTADSIHSGSSFGPPPAGSIWSLHFDKSVEALFGFKLIWQAPLRRDWNLELGRPLRTCFFLRCENQKTKHRSCQGLSCEVAICLFALFATSWDVWFLLLKCCACDVFKLWFGHVSFWNCVCDGVVGCQTRRKLHLPPKSALTLFHTVTARSIAHAKQPAATEKGICILCCNSGFSTMRTWSKTNNFRMSLAAGFKASTNARECPYF